MLSPMARYFSFLLTTYPFSQFPTIRKKLLEDENLIFTPACTRKLTCRIFNLFIDRTTRTINSWEGEGFEKMALSCVSRSPDIILIELLYFTYKQSRNTTRLSIFYDIVTSLKYITAHSCFLK